MLCFPAFTPVANDAHAVGDSGAVRVAEGSFDATIDQGAAASARTKSRLRAAAITEALRSRR